MVNLTRWSPSNEIEVTDPFRSLDQWMNDLWRNWMSRFETDTVRPLLRPAMDVVESNSDITVRLDLPGITPEKVNVQVEDHTLTISGEISEPQSREGERYHYRERAYGAFQRSLRLPAMVDTGSVDASFENGVLTIVIPKLPEAQPKQIEIKAKKNGK